MAVTKKSLQDLLVFYIFFHFSNINSLVDENTAAPDIEIHKNENILNLC